MSSMQDKTLVAQTKDIQKKNRRSFFLMITIFVLPIILAKFALDGQWLATGVTNKGTLLTNELTLEDLGLDPATFTHHWLIVYNLPTNCEVDCQKTLSVVHNTYIALGKDKPRVIPVALSHKDLSVDQRQHLSGSQWQLMSMPTKGNNIINQSQIFIVDPLGNVFLSHQIPDNTEQLPQFGKQILADMKKLLKYSKVG